MGQSWSESLGECTGGREKPEDGLLQPILDEKVQLEFVTWPKTNASRVTGRKCVTVGTLDMAQCPEEHVSSSAMRDAMACGGCVSVGRPMPKCSMERIKNAQGKNTLLLNKFKQLSADILCLQGLGENGHDDPGSPSRKSRPEELITALMAQGYGCSPPIDSIPACSDVRLNKVNYVMTPASQCILYDRQRFDVVNANSFVLEQGATAQEVLFHFERRRYTVCYADFNHFRFSLINCSILFSFSTKINNYYVNLIGGLVWLHISRGAYGKATPTRCYGSKKSI